MAESSRTSVPSNTEPRVNRPLSDKQRQRRYRKLLTKGALEDRHYDLIRWEEVCPDCGLDDLTGEHLGDCPRVNTCGQTTPYLDPPFHPDPRFDHLKGRERGKAWSEWLEHHRRTVHA